MGQMTSYCRDCGQDRLFDQPHEDSCPDVPDGACPEWACTGCGAALITGVTRALAGAGALRPDRVA